MSWTTPDDVADAWIGPDAPSDPVRLQNWIDRAEREIRYRVPDIEERIALEAAEVPARTDLLERAVDVTVAMVTRVFRNPDGTRTVNQSSGTGPFSETVSKTYGGDSPGGLSLTNDELAKLQGRQSGGAFSIDLLPASSPYAAPAWWRSL